MRRKKTMKKNKLTLVAISSFLSLGISGLVSCQKESEGEKESISESFDGEKNEIINDEIGTAVSFAKKLANEEGSTSDTLKSDIGALLIEKDNGTYDIRFVAALTGYSSFKSAKFARAEYTNAAGKTVVGKEAEVSYVYTSVNNADSVKWQTALSSEYTYYMVYSIRNIPETDVFTTFNISLSVTNFSGETIEATQAANVYGLIGDISENVVYTTSVSKTYGDDGITHYGAYADTTSLSTLTTATVAPYVAEFNGFVATKKGVVTELTKRSSSTGAFESCSSLSTLNLPDTIQYFDVYSFYRCSSLTSMTLPRDLTSVASTNCFSYGNSWTTLYWNAVAFESNDKLVSWNLDTIYVSKDVKSLPKYFMGYNCTINKIVYEGTTAEWEALKTDDNKGNGLFIDNVICSDSKIVIVNFHADGGTFMSGYETTNDVYEVKIISGKKVANPGRLKKNGMVFMGWYTDNTYTTEFDFETALSVDEGEETKTVDIYGKFEEAPAGTDFASALELTPNAETLASVEFNADISTWYFKYTNPSNGVKDYYFIKGTNKKLDGESSYADYKIEAIDANQETLSRTSSTISPENLSSYKVFGSTDSTQVVVIEPGETVYFKVSVYTSSVLNSIASGSAFTFDIDFYNFEGDSEDDALSYTLGQTQKTEIYESTKRYQTYKFTATESAKVLAQKIYTGYFYGTVLIYHYVDGTYTKDVELSSSTKLGEFDMVSGTTYYVFCSSSNSDTSETKSMSFYIGDFPDNYNAEKATDIASDGSAVKVDTADFGSKYYKVTPSESGDYSIVLTGGSQDYAKTVTVYAAGSTTEVLASGTETGTTTSSYGWGSTNYGGTLDVVASYEAGKTYIVKVGFTKAPSSNTEFSFSFVKRTEGDLRGNAIALTNVGETNTCEDLVSVGSTSGKWYSFTPKANGYVTFYVTGLGDATAALNLYEGTKTKATLSATSGSITGYFSTTTGTCYLNVVTSAALESVTIKVVDSDSTTLGDFSSLTASGITQESKAFAIPSGVTSNAYWFKSIGTDSAALNLAFVASAGTVTFDYTVYSKSLTVKYGSLTIGTEASSDGSLALALDASTEYYFVINNIVFSDSVATLSYVASTTGLPEDGSKPALAYSMTMDETHGTYTYEPAKVGVSEDLWFKYECTESGTYKFYSSSASTSAADPKIYNVYDGLDNAKAGTYMSDTDDDDSTKGGTSNKYDYYIEASLEAGHTYYFKVKAYVKLAGNTIVFNVEKLADSTTTE